ncbi:hypothetical protein CUMW_016610 [Citrus unshiu]|nr:hypothetical protein CUMW_016610 [Citrus unshiu]
MIEMLLASIQMIGHIMVEEVVRRYREILSNFGFIRIHYRTIGTNPWLCLIMTGPTSFAPIIETASRIVDNSGGQ